MTLRAPVAFAALALAVAVSSPASADVMAFVSVADNTLYQNANGSLSNGAGSGMFAGRTAQLSDQIRRAVVRWDISAIPAGSTINSATILLYMNQTVAGDVLVTVHPVFSSWGEGTSVAGSGQGGGAASTAGDATWRHRSFPGSFWGAPGGDFGGPQTSQTVGDIGTYVFPSSPGMVAQTQFYLNNPASNTGWMLRGDEVLDGSAKRFATKEYPVNELRPALVVEYTPPGTPAEPASWGALKSLYR